MTSSAVKRWAGFLILVIGALTIAGALDASLAQFGVPRNAPPPPEANGFAGWILAKQAEFYRAMSGTIRAARTEGSAAVTLLGISFLYGIFHAAGPGHGKAVISSYMVANDETWRRGIVLSFASALLQALTAILIVGIAAALLGATAKTMGDAVRVIEIVSYALIALVGARLLWVKGRAFIAAWRTKSGAHHHHHDHGHDHHHHGDEDASAWGHAHGPEPQELAGPGGWRRGLSAIFAVGLRPCSGAILVLVFALAQGIFWTGVGATIVMGLGTAITVAAIALLAVGARGVAGRFAKAKPGAGMLTLRGLETAAAAAVMMFGLLLLTGYLASERLMGF
jgi:nickel/cobalt exporter